MLKFTLRRLALLTVLYPLVVPSASFAEHAIDDGNAEATASAVETPFTLARRELENKLNVLVSQIETSAKSGIIYPIGNLSQTLKSLHERLRDNRVADSRVFPGSKLSNDELSVLLDSASVLMEYTQEIMRLYEADPDTDPSALRKTAAENLVKKWRKFGKQKRSLWMPVDTTAPSEELTKELAEREKLVNETTPELMEQFAASLDARLAQAALPLVDIADLFENLKKNPGQAMTSETEKALEDIKRLAPEKSAEVDGMIRKYRTRYEELRRKIEDETRGKSAEELGDKFFQDLKKEKTEVAEMETDLRHFLGEIDDRLKDFHKEKDRLVGEAEKEAKRLESEFNKKKKDVENEAEKQLNRFKRIFDK